MKLSKIAILALRGQKDSAEAIAELVGVSTKTVYRWIAKNNGNLTRAAVLQYLRGITGLGNEELLDEQNLEVGITEEQR